MNTNTRTYQKINAYGVIGDCHSVVLVAPDGSVDWGCLPDFDSPAIFCRLLDEQRGGFFQIAPSDQTIRGMQRYLRGSNVLQTRFAGESGEVILTDFMPVETLSSWQFRELNNNTWTREDGSCHCLVRIIECVQGEMPITMTLKVTPDYAGAPSEVTLVPEGRGAVISGAQQHVGLGVVGAYRLPSFSMFVRQEVEDAHPSIIVQATLQEGERLLFAVGLGRNARAARRLAEEELHLRNFDWELAHTLHCWRTWLKSCVYRGPYAEWVERSVLVLKMMTYAPTGAIVAAPTTSLPEELDGVRNWDYRYTWLRDATFTLYALNVLGFTEEAHSFTHWLRRLSYSNGEDLQIMYGIRGEHDLTEREVPHLSGYCNSAPVRVGNAAAAHQRQLDVFGEVLDFFHLYRRQGCFEQYGETLEGPLWALMRILVDHVCDHWQEMDSGIWEVRGGPRHFVYSKVMCWVALDRGIRAAQQLHLEADLPRWYNVREQIRTAILSYGYNTAIGAFTQAFDDTALDASNLLLPLVGFISPDDPRMRSTVDRIIEQLTDEHGFVYRYQSDDGLAGGEGTFTICTFWLVDNLAMQGRLEEAKSLFERLLAYAGQVGLFSEEIDSRNAVALGNYPQAFTHIALINSALNLQKAEKRLAKQYTDPVMAAIKLQISDSSSSGGIFDSRINIFDHLHKENKSANGSMSISMFDEGILKRLHINDKRPPVRVEVASPLRIDLGMGGLSDISPWTNEQFGRAVSLCANINHALPIRCVAEVTNEPGIVLESVGRGPKETVLTWDELAKFNTTTAIARACIQHLFYMPEKKQELRDVIEVLFGGGLQLQTFSNAPKGLGSSSILASALLQAIFHLLGRSVDWRDIVHRTVTIEHMISAGGGWEDPLSAFFGGAVLAESIPSQPPIISAKRLVVSPQTLNALEESFVLFDTEIEGHTGQVLAKGALRYLSGDPEVFAACNTLLGIAGAVANAIEKGDFESLGVMLNEQWSAWKTITGGLCTNSYIEGILAGAIPWVNGAKVNGAGSGGAILFAVKSYKRNQLLQYLQRIKGTVINWRPDSGGYRIQEC